MTTGKTGTRQATACALALALASAPAAGEALFDAPGRAALGAEIRALLLEEPQIIGRALAPPSPYEAAISDDMARLERLAPHLFDPSRDGFGPADATQHMALFVKPDCPDCRRAADDLRAMAQAHGLRVTLFRMDDAADAALAAELQLSDMPAYVLPRMMLQGHIPPVVLERYLTR